MKHTFSKLSQAIFLLCSLILLTGISMYDSNRAISPFSKASWNYSKEDILKLEGSSYKTYDSVYGGDCYTYTKAYEGYNGTIKYMLDQDNRLRCIAWTCVFDNEEDLHTLYETISKSATEQYGGTCRQTNESTNFGNVWYRDKGNIVISTMVTDELKALQYAFLHPNVSSPEQK